MTASWVPPDYTGMGSAEAWMVALDGNMAILRLQGDAFNCHASSPAAMSVEVAPGLVPGLGVLPTPVSQQSVSIAAADPTDPRKDTVYIDRLTAAAGVVAGTPDPAPTTPAPPAGKIAVAVVDVAAGATAIANPDITDLRALGRLGLGNVAGDDVVPVARGGTGGVTEQAARDGIGLETVSQAEAEAGTATTTRAWTAQRVRQAVDAAGGKIVGKPHVVQTQTTQSFSGTSYTALPLQISHTLDDAANHVAITAAFQIGQYGPRTFASLFRDGTTELTPGSGSNGAGAVFAMDNGGTQACTFVVDDAPGDTSSHTYRLYAKTTGATAYFNRDPQFSAETTNSGLMLIEYKP